MDPARSHDRELSPTVAVRWWGSSKNLDIDWRVAASGDKVHEDGTPLMRVTGILSKKEAEGLYQFLGQILGPDA